MHKRPFGHYINVDIEAEIRLARRASIRVGSFWLVPYTQQWSPLPRRPVSIPITRAVQFMAEFTAVNTDVVAALRSAVKDCSERGLTFASKW